MSRALEADHLGEQDLRDLAQGKRSGAELLARVLEHVAQRCPVCRATLAEYPRRHLVERLPGRYEEAIEAAVEAGAERAVDHAREHQEALPIVEELDPPRPLPQALALVTSTPRFHRWGVATRLADAAEALLEEDPDSACYWATLAVAIALAIEPGRCSGEAVLETLRCATRIVLARALSRSRERAGDAEEELARAAEHFAGSTHNPRLETELALARAELPVSGRSWSELLADLRRLEGRRELRESPELGARFLKLLAVAFRESGHLDAALSGFRAVLEAAAGPSFPLPAGERRRFERLLAQTLLAAERYPEAWAALADDEGALRSDGAPLERAARERLGACALVGLGRSAEAFPLLGAARERLVAEELGFAAAAVLLDELALRLRKAEKPEAEKLLDELPGLYAAEGLPRWARRPLIRLQRAGWRRELTAEDVEEARDALASGPPEASPGPAPPAEVVH